MSMSNQRLAAMAGAAKPVAESHKPIPESLRSLIFLELVQAQDEGLTVARSRARIAAKHRILPEQVVSIEAEGLVKAWAPL